MNIEEPVLGNREYHVCLVLKDGDDGYIFKDYNTFDEMENEIPNIIISDVVQVMICFEDWDTVHWRYDEIDGYGSFVVVEIMCNDLLENCPSLEYTRMRTEDFLQPGRNIKG